MTSRGPRNTKPANELSAPGPVPDRGPEESESVAYEHVVLRTARGPVETRFYCRPDFDCGAI